MLRRISVIALGLAVAVCHAEIISSRGFALYVERTPTSQEAGQNFTGAKFEPMVGCYAGAYIDLDTTITDTFVDRTNKVRRLPRQFEEKVGKQHATYFYYMGYRSRLAYDWISKLGQDGKIVHIALEPNLGLEWVKDDDYLEEMATMFAKSGTPIFLRFASEMNGPWVNYHGNPKLYIEKFRLIAKKMREKAPNVAMVWCPYATPTKPIQDYYPGDEYVDWVGVNLYSVTYFNQDIKQPARHIHPVTMLEYVYDRYAAKKPIMIGEYGATHFSALENKPTVDFAARSIMAVYEALPRAYPRVKCINYFSGNNLILDHRKNNNYAITQHPKMLDVYRNLIASPYFLSLQVNEDGLLATSLLATPVSGEAPTWEELVPMRPMRVTQKDVFSGTVRLSGWIRDHSGRTSLKFNAGGKTLHIGMSKDKWSVDLDTTKLANGPVKLELVAIRGTDVVNRYPVTVTVQN